MRRFLYSLVFLTFIIVSGYYFFTQWQHRQQTDVWAIIPDNALLVLEHADVLQLRREWRQYPPYQRLESLPYFRTLAERIDTLLQADESVPDFLAGKTIHSSLHVTGSGEFDLLFYIPLRSVQEQNLVETLTGRFSQHRRYRTSKRAFQNLAITEVSLPQTTTIFSYTIHNHVLIGSYTPFLVEDAIRTIQESAASDKRTWVRTGKQRRPSTGTLEIYIRADNGLSRLAGAFTGNPGAVSPLLRQLGQFSQLQVRADDQQIRLEGSALSSPGSGDYLNVFRMQLPQPLACTHLIPSNTALVYHLGFSNAPDLGSSLQAYWQVNDPETSRAQETLYSRYEWHSSRMFEWMGREIALAVLECNQPEPGLLLLIEANDRNEALGNLKLLEKKLTEAAGTELYAETYGDVPIRQISLADFPAKVLGSPFGGFTQCFYAPVGNYIVFANRLQHLKTWLNDLRTQNVWKQSAQQQAWLRSIPAESNLGIYVSTSRAWSLMHQHTLPKWQKLMNAEAETLQQFTQGAIQFSHEQAYRFRAGVYLNYANNKPRPREPQKFLVNTRTPLEHALHTPPFVVRNHLDKSREILVQDAQHQVYLVNNLGKVLWKKPVGEKILGEITQIDYFKNNKLQYLFATPRHLMLLDRNGNPVPPFPLPAPSGVLWHSVSVLDYDNNRNYRMLAADINGNLYLYDKEGKALDGWNPLKTGYRLNGAPRHIRVSGKDYIIAAQANGLVQVMNRRGESYPGFPFNIQAWTSNPLYWEAGPDAGKTVLTALSDGGEIIRFNLLGELVERRQLYRPSRNTQFRLCPEARQQAWLVVRYDNRILSILNDQGRVLFEKAWESQAQPLVQYYDFGASFRLIAITNPATQETHLYDYTGKPVGESPLPNRGLLSMLYVEEYDKLLIYRSGERETGIVSLKLK